MVSDPQAGGSLAEAIQRGELSLDDALTHYRPPTGGERAQTFAAVLARSARDAYLSGTSAELRIAERGLAMLGADSAAEWVRGFADYVAPGGGFADDVGDVTGMSLPEVPEAAQNDSAVSRAFTQLLPEGLGSSLGIVALPGPKGLGGVATRGALVGAGQQFVEAKAEGADDDVAWTAFVGGAALGATDAWSPLGKLFSRANRASRGALVDMVWDGVVKGGAQEATQETFQSIGENFLAGVLYDEDRKIIEGVLDAGTGGALTGMLIGALAGHQRLRGEQAQAGQSDVGIAPGQPQANIAPTSIPVAPSSEQSALMTDLGASSLEEAPEEIKRYVESRGGRVALARGEGGARLRRPAAIQGTDIVLDAEQASEAFLDHEVGHLAFGVDPGGSAMAKAAIEQLAPDLHAAAQEDYVQDVLADRRRAEGRDITPEEEAEIRSATPPDEAFARVNEDFSGIVRLLRRNPEAFARLDNPGTMKRVFRAVVDFGRKLTGKPVPDRQRLALAEAWKALGAPGTVTPEVGLQVAGVLREYLDSMPGRAKAPQSQENPTSLPSSLPVDVVAPEPVEPTAPDVLPEVSTEVENGTIPEPTGPGLAPGRTDTYVGRRLLSFPGATLDAAIADRLQREDAALREQFPGRGDAWYARVADARRQARDPRNPEGEQAALVLRRAGVQPLAPDRGGYHTEDYMDARAQQRTGKPDSSKVGQGPKYAAERRPNLDGMRASVRASTDEQIEETIRSEGQSPDDAARRIYAIMERARRSGDTGTLNEIRKMLGGDAQYAVVRRAMPMSGGAGMTWDLRDRLLAYAVDAWRAPGRWRDALATAGKVTDANDVVLQETLRRSGTLKVVQDESAAYVVPLRELLAGGAVSLDDAGRYLLARAAPDRNALILSRGGPADGSGMSDAAAAKIVAAAQSGPHAARYADIATAFDRLTGRKLELMEQYGLLSPAQAADLRTQEPLYAPMKRDPQSERLYGEAERPTVGVARTRRKEFRAATGRSTEAENPIVYATMDLMAAIERGMWNATTGRAVLEMAREFSDPKIALVDVPAIQRTVGATGQIIETPAQERENEIVVKENGVPRVVRFGKGWETVAAAIKGSDKGTGDALLAALRPITRTLAGLSTRWNPFFQPVNVVRDALGAYLNASADHGPAAAAAMVNPKTVGAMMRDAAKGGPWSVRFANAGGPVAFLDLARTFEEEAKRTIKGIESAQSTNAPWRMTRRYAASLVGLLEKMGHVSENATRMAAFKYAVEELGASDARAAQYAKNITTNFERRGSNPWMSALFAFSNAGIQGTARVGQALRTPWGQRAAAGLVAGAFLLSHMNRITGGDDEDGVPRWDKIPEWQRRSNAILLVGDTKLMVPMPFVWNIFHALGTEIERGAFGHQGPLESSSAVGSAMAGALNPLGGEADFIDTVTPTLLDPIVQVARNRDYAGRRIFPESFNAQQPDSGLAWDETSPTLQTLAAGLNSLSGGDAGTPGLVDVSPATVEFVFKQYLGGLGGESSRVLRLAEKMLRGEDVDAGDIPAVRRFVGSLGIAEQRSYYKGKRALIEAQVLREKAGEPYDANLWRMRKRANRWDEKISELEKAARGAVGPERDRIRAQLRAVFLEATEDIEEATK